MDLENPSVEMKTRAVDQRVQNLIQQARQGDVEAYNSLALCYRDGDGVEKSWLNMTCMYAIYCQKTGGDIEDVIELLEELSQKGVRMCIATATDRYQVEAALMRCGMRHFFSEIFTCTEVGSGKDQPFIFRKAMEHLGTDRSNTVVVEDAWHAIRTAKDDGFMVAAVYDAHESMQRSIRETADIYLTDYFHSLIMMSCPINSAAFTHNEERFVIT